MDYVFATWFISLFAALVGAASVIPAFIMGLFPKREWRLTAGVTLVSLRGQSGVRGNFFLGTGASRALSTTSTTRRWGEGYRPGKIPIDDNVTVFEEDRQDGELIEFKERFTHRWWKVVALEFAATKYEIRIPQGSLLRDFELK